MKRGAGNVMSTGRGAQRTGVPMLTRKIVTAAGISIFALSLAACAHDPRRSYDRPGYDYRHDGHDRDQDRRFDRGWERDSYGHDSYRY